MLLTGLPLEVISGILDYLPLRDLLSVSCTCHALNDAGTLSYHRGNHSRALRTLRRPITSDSVISYRDVHRELLRTYGWLYGLWHIKSTVYGGLLHVTFNGYELVGMRYSDPPEIYKPLRKMKLFTICVVGGVNGPACFTACHRFDCRELEAGHQAIIEKMENQDTELRITCDGQGGNPAVKKVWFQRYKDALLYSNATSDEEDFSYSGEPDEFPDPDMDCFGVKFKALQAETSAVCSRLHMPSAVEGAVIQPGLFKGTYGSHGIELLLLTYSDDMKTATLTKITGDANVPTDKVSVEVDLEQKIQQNTEGESGSPVNPLAPGTQRYSLPEDYYSEYEGIPLTCLARYKSKGQIAGDGYDNPSFIDGVWVVFDEDRFGHEWSFLNSFSMYTRIEETFPLMITAED